MDIPADDYTIRYVRFPYSISALTAQDETGHYNIYINTALSRQNQQAALAHEIRHLLRHDFSPDKTLEETEPYRQASPSLPLSPMPPAAAGTADRPVHVLTIGQLLRFMVSLEEQREQKKLQSRGSVPPGRPVSIDIFKEPSSRQPE